MASIFKALPLIVQNIAANIDQVVYAFVEGFIANIGEIANAFIDEFIARGGAVKIGLANAEAIIWKVPAAIVLGIINGLAMFFKNLFGMGGGIKIDTPKAIKDLPKNLSNSWKKLGQIVSADSSKLFAVKDFQKLTKGGANLANQIGDAIGLGIEIAVDKIKGLWEQFIDWLQHMWDSLVSGIITAWRWIYDNIIMLFINALRAVWQFVWDTILLPIIDALYVVWQWVYDMMSTVWLWVKDNVITPMLDGLMAVWMWLNDNIIVPMATVVQAEWQFVVDLFAGETFKNAGKALWAGFKESFDTAFEGLKTSFKTLGKAAWGALTDGTLWDSLKTNLTTLGKNVWQSLSGVWDWLTSNLKSLGKNVWYSLSDVWDWLTTNIKNVGKNIWYSLADVWDWLVENLKSLGSVLFGGGGGGGGYAGQLASQLGLADGGVVKTIYAQGGVMIPKGTDTVPAMLTPGEFVVNRDSTAANMGLLAAINAARGQPVAAGVGGAAQQVVLNVTINAKTLLDAQQIKREVLPEIDKHLKRRSLDGAFVLATAGVQAAR